MPVPVASTSRTGSLLLSIVAAVAILSIFPFSGTAQSSASAPVTIVMKQMRFNPPQQTVTPGTEVEWKNEDIYSHTVTADDGSFDSGLIAPGQSWKMTFKDAGTFAYHCRPHPNMKATLVVSSGAENTKLNSPQTDIGAETGDQSLRLRPPTSPQEI